MKLIYPQPPTPEEVAAAQGCLDIANQDVALMKPQWEAAHERARAAEKLVAAIKLKTELAAYTARFVRDNQGKGVFVVSPNGTVGCLYGKGKQRRELHYVSVRYVGVATASGPVYACGPGQWSDSTRGHCDWTEVTE